MLSINIWDFLWTVISFFVLYFVLKKLLFDPVHRFTDERKARIEAGLNAQREAQEAVQAKENELAGLKDDCRREARRILDQARAEDEAQSAGQAERLRQESAQARQELRQELSRRQELDGQRLDSAQTELAAVLADRLLDAGGQKG